jgi:RNA polymerase sigma-70 factor (ECF subfamily)
MMDESHSVGLTSLLQRMQSGDMTVRNQLFRTAQTKLEQLARRMLRRQMYLRRWAETDDVLQNACIRLMRALDSTTPTDSREFFNLVAAMIRRELIDLARYFLAARRRDPDRLDNQPEPVAPDVDWIELDRWTALHEAVEQLPVELREVFALTLYHGWTQPEIAKLFGVDVRTVRRRWRTAIEALHQALGGAFPED